MRNEFSTRIDNILNEFGVGHWKAWDGKEPIHSIVDPKSWPKFNQMDPSTGRSKKRKKVKRIAGKL